MAATTAAASVAAVSGLAAYLNGKYHLAQDIKTLRFRRNAAKYYAGIGTSIDLMFIQVTMLTPK
jgi:hypothetical protein